MERRATDYLQTWKSSTARKPLIIRGARQVGKTTLVKNFGKTYSNFIYLNLELPQHRRLFEQNEGVHAVLDAILLSEQSKIKENDTLLFIDEVQESPKAIQLLRYFYEEFPRLHVIAAGSLLEFALKTVKSFPVGRVEHYVVHPLDFEEFLLAIGRNDMVELLATMPIPDYAHSLILEQYNQYMIIGGMPEIVANYAKHKSISAISTIYESLWQGYKDDIEKYSTSESERKVIRHVINTAAAEKDRISFNGFGNSNYKSREIGEALRTLDQSRLIQLIYPTTNVGLPMLADSKKKPRLQFLDTGLFNHAAGMQAQMIGLKDMHEFHRGKVLYHSIAQQIQAQHHQPGYKTMFWVREKTNSSAEVDLVVPYRDLVIPIEIKSGSQGKLRSLHQYMQECNHGFAVRFLANKMSIEEATTASGVKYRLLNLPYYLGTRLNQYMRWFIEAA